MSIEKIICEYVWVDGNQELRSKYRTINKSDLLHLNLNENDFYEWNYDGSSTYQAETENSEIILCPVGFYPNPFFEKGTSFLVLCETYYKRNDEYIPTSTNHRYDANNLFNQKKETEPWYGIEQEYFMMSPGDGFGYESKTPLAFYQKTPQQQGNYYCGVGNKNIQFRSLAEKHYKYCLEAGLSISGINAEVAPNQWEFQIGPCTGIQAADQLWIARYILHKLSEEFHVNISFRPKPISNPWNGSGLHTNFSTIDTRKEGGLDIIHRYISLLSSVHAEHLSVYGDNSERLNGSCETSDINTFTYGMGNRGCSIRIPSTVIKNGCGYFEDRRPASDADPYQVTSAIFKTCCLGML